MEKKMEIKIGRYIISNEGRPYFIADIAANHDGDLKRAFRLIELSKETGADVAKFQNFKAKTIVSRNGFDSMHRMSHQANWTKSVYEVYEDASVADEWTERLKEKCDEVGIEYMTSPYDFEAIDLAAAYVNAYKVGSGDITWLEIIEYMAKKGKPMLLATGASDMEDVIRAYDCIKSYTSEIVLMQCNTNYTASLENYQYVNLNVLIKYREMFPDCILGLSDHTFGHTTVLGALALGARVFEKHFTDDNGREGPDHKFAMNPTTFKEMVVQANLLYEALGDGVKRVEANEVDSAVVQRRALYLLRDMKKGETITKQDLFPLRPIKTNGLPPYEAERVIGRQLLQDRDKDSYLRWEDLNK
jgi:N-acetylneuraminate synthase